MFNPASDLTAIQNILMADATILSLMDLSGQKLESRANDYIEERKKAGQTVTFERACYAVIRKSIIKRSQWTELNTGEKLLCIYFRPSRRTRNQKFFEEVLQIDCHVPADDDYKAYQIQQRLSELLHEKKVNKRYLYFDGQLGELPTMSGFFCAGSRYIFNRKV